MKEPTAGQLRSGWQGSIVLVKLSEQVEPTMKPSEALAAHRNEIRE